MKYSIIVLLALVVMLSSCQSTEEGAFDNQEVAIEELDMTWNELEANFTKKKANERIPILDARNEAEYDQGHIISAKRIGYSEEDFTNENVWHLRRKEPVIVYCNNGEIGALAAEKVKAMGFVQVYNLPGGLDEWERRGLSIDIKQ